MEDAFAKFRLEGRVAIVTGGSGQLGSRFVKSLAAAGAKVAVFDLKANETGAGGARFYEVDIADRASVDKAVAKVVKELGHPRVLVNCAAIDIPPNYGAGMNSGLLETKEMEALYDKVIAVNVKGMLLCSQVVAKAMADGKQGGSIINISSIYGEVSPDQRIYLRKGKEGAFVKPIAYCVSKGAVPNLSRYLATYFAKDRIRVNTLTFGGVFNSQDPEFVANYSYRVPLGRMADRDEYDGAILFLASDASSYMTGSNLVMDGGYTAL
jgi:NAD(P)-dependent dehydrogenase (short-subunit alcohol dehydrogenase family)